MSAAPRADHPHMRYPKERPTVYGHVLGALTNEARALVFTIFALGCLLLAFALVSLTLHRERPRARSTGAQVDREVKLSPRTVPQG